MFSICYLAALQFCFSKKITLPGGFLIIVTELREGLQDLNLLKVFFMRVLVKLVTFSVGFSD